MDEFGRPLRGDTRGEGRRDDRPDDRGRRYSPPSRARDDDNRRGYPSDGRRDGPDGRRDERPRDDRRQNDRSYGRPAEDMRQRDIRSDILNRWKQAEEGSAAPRDDYRDERRGEERREDRGAYRNEESGRDTRPPPEYPRRQYNDAPGTSRPGGPPPMGAGSYLEARILDRRSRPTPWVWSVSPARDAEKDKEDEERARGRAKDPKESKRRRESPSRSPSRHKHRSSRKHSSRHHKKHKKHRHSRHSSRSPPRSRSPSSSSSGSEASRSLSSSAKRPRHAPEGEPEAAEAAPAPSTAPAPATGAPHPHAESEDEEVGPQLPSNFNPDDHMDTSNLNFGRGLRPGEGAAMASYVEANERIPRRGEVGWQGETIAKLENLGYIMSGSRHKRMTEVRLRKENQVMTAAETKALAQHNFEEKASREARVMAEFRELIAGRKGGDAGAGTAAKDAPAPDAP